MKRAFYTWLMVLLITSIYDAIRVKPIYLIVDLILIAIMVVFSPPPDEDSTE